MSFLWIATQVFRLARNDEVVFGLLKKLRYACFTKEAKGFLKKLRYACFATILRTRVESHKDESIRIASKLLASLKIQGGKLPTPKPPPQGRGLI